eukprot:7123230-Prymnesium_polylepis.1
MAAEHDWTGEGQGEQVRGCDHSLGGTAVAAAGRVNKGTRPERCEVGLEHELLQQVHVAQRHVVPGRVEHVPAVHARTQVLVEEGIVLVQRVHDPRPAVFEGEPRDPTRVDRSRRARKHVDDPLRHAVRGAALLHILHECASGLPGSGAAHSGTVSEPHSGDADGNSAARHRRAGRRE